MTKSIYNDRDYFDNMFKEIKGELECIREDLSGKDGRPGIKERLSNAEWRIKAIIGSFPLISAVYIRESRDFLINLFKVFVQ